MLKEVSALSENQYNALKQGDKIRFKWHGNSELEYIGRIEVDKYGEKYFVNEFNYEGDKIKEHCEGMRYYNPLMDFFNFTEFEVLS